MEELVQHLAKGGKKEIFMMPSNRELRRMHVIRCIYPRKCYSEGLEYVAKMLEDRKSEIIRFGGTPGVGKTTFRYWVLRRWLLGKMKGLPEFKHMLFSVGTEDLFLLSKDDGAVSVTCPGPANKVFPQVHKWSKDCLGEVEMSKSKSGIDNISTQACPCVSLLLIVGSPGKFTKGGGCFKGKAPKPFYFPVWKKKEVLKLPSEIFCGTNIDDAEQISRYVEYGGVLRLMQFLPAQAKDHIDEALERLQLSTLQLVVDNVVTKESDLVHRLLKINKRGKVESFISTHVARVAMAQLDKIAHDSMTEFMATIADSAQGKSLTGFFFEERFGLYFVEPEARLLLSDGTILLGPKNGVQNYVRKQQTFHLDTLYRPPAGFQGIDFFILKPDCHVYLLQTTIASTHTPADFTHNDHAELQPKLRKHYKLGEKQKLNLHMIYVLPCEQTMFTMPSLPKECTHTVARPERPVLKRKSSPHPNEPNSKKPKKN